MAWLLAAVVALAPGVAAAQPAAAPEPPVLRASADQSLSIRASGDPRQPHLFFVDGEEAGRRWVVSINVALDGASELDRRLVQELTGLRLTDAVLIEDFRPPRPPRCVELQVGSRVPVALVQAVVRSLLPMEHRWSVQLAEDDEEPDTGAPQRIYIGGMVQRPCALAPPSRLRELAAPGLTPSQLHRLLRSINGTLRQHAHAADVVAAANARPSP